MVRNDVKQTFSLNGARKSVGKNSVLIAVQVDCSRVMQKHFYFCWIEFHKLELSSFSHHFSRQKKTFKPFIRKWIENEKVRLFSNTLSMSMDFQWNGDRLRERISIECKQKAEYIKLIWNSIINSFWLNENASCRRILMKLYLLLNQMFTFWFSL